MLTHVCERLRAATRERVDRCATSNVGHNSPVCNAARIFTIGVR